MREQRAEIAARELRLRAEEREREVARPLVRDADGRIFGQADQAEQVLRPEVLQRPLAHRREVKLARALADIGDEIFHRCIRRIALHRADIRIYLQQRQKRKIVRAVGCLAIGRRQYHLRCDPRKQQAVTVRRGSADGQGTDRAGRAGLVHHHQRLAVEIARRILGQVPRGEIGVAAGGIRHDEQNRARRILRMRRQRSSEQSNEDQAAAHQRSAQVFAYQDFTPAWSRTASCTRMSFG